MKPLVSYRYRHSPLRLVTEGWRDLSIDQTNYQDHSTTRTKIKEHMYLGAFMNMGSLILVLVVE